VITQEEVRTLFDYREDGALIRKVSVGGPAGQIGRAIGSVSTGGAERPDKKYLITKISGKHYCAHKLVYLWHYGQWPEQLDHINRDSLDNRVENLRPANACTNMQNRKVFKSNTSGAKGVAWNKRANKWQVYVGVERKIKHIGYFDNFELAELVAHEARQKFHGVFAD
jgi:hypothetical protein